MGCGASTRQKDDRQAFLIVPQVSEFSAEDEPEPPRDIRDFYVLGEVLGSGAFGQVRSACLIQDPSQLRAVKVLEKDGNVRREDLDQEVKLLGQLEHENIIRFHDVYEDVHFLYLVTDHCAGGEVFAKIVELRRFTEENAAFMGKQMLAAIAYLHDRRIVHRDVKAENFLLAEPTIHSKIKMIDFGMACRFEEGQFLTELCGSPHYVAPELIGQRYTELVDVWAFGVLMYLLMYGAYPYDGKDPKEIMIKVVTKKIPWQKRALLSNTCLDCLTTAQHLAFLQSLPAPVVAGAMPDMVGKKVGGRVVMVSSLDEGHPGENIIDGREETYWISTGLYPQEILLGMSERSMVSTVKIVTSNVRSLRIESCAEDDPVNFKTLAEDELEELSGRLQVKEIPCQGVEPAAYIKVLILSGYHDFCTVHRVIVE